MDEKCTKNGRIVLDGAGVKPDVEIKRERSGSVIRSLISGDYVFNFATKYTLDHDTINPPKTFKLSEIDFNEFISFLDSSGYQFETGTDIHLKSLEVKARDEEYLSIIQSELDLIKNKLAQNKTDELLFSAPLHPCSRCIVLDPRRALLLKKTWPTKTGQNSDQRAVCKTFF